MRNETVVLIENIKTDVRNVTSIGFYRRVHWKRRRERIDCQRVSTSFSFRLRWTNHRLDVNRRQHGHDLMRFDSTDITSNLMWVMKNKKSKINIKRLQLFFFMDRRINENRFDFVCIYQSYRYPWLNFNIFGR